MLNFLRVPVSGFHDLQILWNSSCLDSLLLSMHNDPPSAVVSDPAFVANVRSLYQKVVREWIVVSLSHAPCTSQGLLQVYFFLACESSHVSRSSSCVFLLWFL